MLGAQIQVPILQNSELLQSYSEFGGEENH